MGLIADQTGTLVAPAPRASSIPRRQGRRRNDPFFTDVNAELGDKGFLVTSTDDLIQLGPHRLADVDDVRPRLLRRRDDADVDAAL